MWLTILEWTGANKLLASLIGGLVIAGLLGGAYWWITDAAYDRGAADMKAKWTESAAKWKAYTDWLGEKYRADTTALQATADTLRNQKDENDAKNRADVERIARELQRERNRRPPGPVPAAAIAPGTGRPGTCTLRDVYADDAEWLVRLAGAADAANNALIQCRGLYSRARQTLNGAAP